MERLFDLWEKVEKESECPQERVAKKPSLPGWNPLRRFKRGRTAMAETGDLTPFSPT